MIDIELLEPGIKLDLLLASSAHIEGVKIETNNPLILDTAIPFWKYNGGYRQQFQPSELIEHAFAYFSRMAQKNNWALSYRNIAVLGEGWFVEDGGEYSFYSLSGYASKTPAMAICKAMVRFLSATHQLQSENTQ